MNLLPTHGSGNQQSRMFIGPNAIIDGNLATDGGGFDNALNRARTNITPGIAVAGSFSGFDNDHAFNNHDIRTIGGTGNPERRPPWDSGVYDGDEEFEVRFTTVRGTFDGGLTEVSLLVTDGNPVSADLIPRLTLPPGYLHVGWMVSREIVMPESHIVTGPVTFVAVIFYFEN